MLITSLHSTVFLRNTIMHTILCPRTDEMLSGKKSEGNTVLITSKSYNSLPRFVKKIKTFVEFAFIVQNASDAVWSYLLKFPMVNFLSVLMIFIRYCKFQKLLQNCSLQNLFQF